MSDIAAAAKMRIVLKAAEIDGDAATAYLEQHEGLVDLIGKLAREAKIAPTKAYDALFAVPEVLPELKGSERSKKINAAAFTDDELTQIGKYISAERERNKDKVVTGPTLMHMARHGSRRSMGSGSYDEDQRASTEEEVIPFSR